MTFDEFAFIVASVFMAAFPRYALLVNIDTLSRIVVSAKNYIQVSLLPRMQRARRDLLVCCLGFLLLYIAHNPYNAMPEESFRIDYM